MGELAMTGKAPSPAETGQVITLIASSSSPESFRQTLQAAFPSQLVTYSTPSEIERTHGNNPLSKLILLWVNNEASSIEDSMTALSKIVPNSLVVVFSDQDNEKLRQRALSLGAKGYIPFQRAGDIAVIVTRFILTTGTDTATNVEVAEQNQDLAREAERRRLARSPD
jgi:DNA-binding NarL/FixJ family response regulator